MKRERGQGLRLERGSGGLGARKRIDGGLKTPKSQFSQEERKRRKRAHLLVNKYLACFWCWKTVRLMNVKMAHKKKIITLHWRKEKCKFSKNGIFKL